MKMPRLFASAFLGCILSGTIVGCSESPSPTMTIGSPTKIPNSPPPPTSRFPKVECLVDEFGIAKKAVMTERGVRCLSQVPNGSPVGEPLHFFYPYFVHDSKDADGLTYYKIGDTPRKESCRGWVPASVAALWTTRIGAGYLSNGNPLLMYETKDAVVELIKTGNTSAEPMARAESSGRKKWMQWPITESHLVEHEGKMFEVVRVMVLGEFRDGPVAPRTGPPSTGPVYTASEQEKMKQNARRIEVVFVVDNTASTTPFIDQIRQSVREIVKQLDSLPNKPDVSFSMVLYRDYVDGLQFRDEQNNLSVVKAFSFQKHEPFLETLAHVEPATISSDDEAEAVFDGVSAGLKQFEREQQQLSDRVVVLIGDNSGHLPGHPKNPNGFSSEGLVSEAKQLGVRIFSLCIKGIGGDDEQKLHQEQWGVLGNQSGGESYPIEETSKVVPKFQEILSKRVETVIARVGVLDELGKGKTLDRAIQTVDERQRTEIVEFLKRANIDPSRFRPNVPSFALAWCAVEVVPGYPLLEKKVFITRREIDLLLAELNTLCVFLSPLELRQLDIEAMSAKIGPESFFSTSGDSLPSETFDISLRKKGIPSHLGLLKLTREEIEHMAEEPRAKLRERMKRQVIPELQNARNNNQMFPEPGDLEFGWVDESNFP